MRKRVISEEELKEEKKAIEEITEFYEEEPRKKKRKKIKRKSKKSDYFFTILVNAVLLYVFNNLLKGNPVFVTDDFSSCLPVFNLSFGAAILGNLVLLFNDEERLKSFIKMALNVLGVAVLYSLYKYFPFDFSAVNFPNAELLAKIVLLSGIVAAGVAAIVEFFKVVFNTFDWK